MRRFFVEPTAIDPPHVWFDLRQSHHIEIVLRMGPGQIVTVFDGKGNEYQVRLLKRERQQPIRGEIIKVETAGHPSVLRLVLAQGIAKGEKMDTIIQKATELGAEMIIPLLTERCVVRWDPAKAEKKVNRWQLIAQEACKQCRRASTPLIMPVMCWTELIPELTKMPSVMFYEQERNGTLRSFVDYCRTLKDFSSIMVIIGPEGGFSAKEAEYAAQYGGFLCGLGPRILRTETAGLAAISVLMYELGDWE